MLKRTLKKVDHSQLQTKEEIPFTAIEEIIVHEPIFVRG